VSVDSGPDRGSSQRQFLEPLGARLNSLDTEFDLPGIAAEFLPQPDRSRIGEMGAADFHDPVEFFGFFIQRLVQLFESGEELSLDRFKR
jgi:hypothetical protein